jgi:hypothetical protein
VVELEIAIAHFKESLDAATAKLERANADLVEAGFYKEDAKKARKEAVEARSQVARLEGRLEAIELIRSKAETEPAKKAVPGKR